MPKYPGFLEFKVQAEGDQEWDYFDMDTGRYLNDLFVDDPLGAAVEVGRRALRLKKMASVRPMTREESEQRAHDFVGTTATITTPNGTFNGVVVNVIALGGREAILKVLAQMGGPGEAESELVDYLVEDYFDDVQPQLPN